MCSLESAFGNNGLFFTYLLLQVRIVLFSCTMLRVASLLKEKAMLLSLPPSSIIDSDLKKKTFVCIACLSKG